MQLVQADGLYYSVSHTILGEMALAAIGKTRRRLLHRRAGEVLQQRVDGAALAAFHFEAAAMAEAAAQNYFSAAQHAWALFAAEPALQSLTRALALSPVSAPLLFAIYALHEEVLHHLGRRNERESVLGALLELASKLSHNEQITAAFRNGRYLFARNRWQAAEERLLAAQRCRLRTKSHCRFR